MKEGLCLLHMVGGGGGYDTVSISQGTSIFLSIM